MNHEAACTFIPNLHRKNLWKSGKSVDLHPSGRTADGYPNFPLAF